MRPDEWSAADLDALGGHLADCAACRQYQAAFRLVGEQIRQLPSIAPPADFRARVFAAIREEELRAAPAILRLSREATNPSLPVVRSRAVLRQTPRRTLAPRFALAAAAALVVALLGARVVPLVTSGGFGAVGANLNSARHAGAVNVSSLGYSVGAAVAASLPAR
jgi:negative regulator of sigma E activity